MQSIEYLGNKVSAEHQEIIQLATNNIKRANSIVGTLLDFSKAKELNMEPEDINLILNDALVLTRYSNVKDKVKVVKEFGRDLPKVLVDRQKMEQVFVNIFLNAMQAMSGEGNIFVRTYLVEFNNLPEEAKGAINDPVIKQAVIIEIQDEGVGIPEENMKNVFRPFFTTKGAMMGIGLGLSVVKDIITMHEGYIEIKSQLNKGTKVIVTLRAITE
jgi:signal transduction histidine kinase